MTGYNRTAWTEFIGADQSAAPIREVEDFQPQVVKLAQLCGWRPYHTRDSRRSAAGFPDLILIKDADLIAAELKVGARTSSPEQLYWLGIVRPACRAALAIVWRPNKAPKAEKWWRVETSEGADWGAIGRRLRGET